MVCKRTGKEAVQLHQETKVRVVALGCLAVAILDVVTVEIDTWCLWSAQLLFIWSVGA